MSIHTSRKKWEGFAQRDSSWANGPLLNCKDKGWNEEYFFQTGQSEIETVLNKLEEEDFLPEDRSIVLDFGCGLGRLSRALTSYFGRVVGLDVSPSMIEQAKAIHGDHWDHLEFYVSTEDDLSIFEENHFSCIYSSIVLQYIPKPDSLKLISAFMRVLKPNGRLIMQIPTRDLRSRSITQKIVAQARLNVRETWRRLGFSEGNHKTIYTTSEKEIEDIIYKHGGEIMATYYTNHLAPDFAGQVHWLKFNEVQDFLSTMFIVRKKASMSLPQPQNY